MQTGRRRRLLVPGLVDLARLSGDDGGLCRRHRTQPAARLQLALARRDLRLVEERLRAALDGPTETMHDRIFRSPPASASSPACTPPPGACTRTRRTKGSPGSAISAARLWALVMALIAFSSRRPDLGTAGAVAALLRRSPTSSSGARSNSGRRSCGTRIRASTSSRCSSRCSAAWCRARRSACSSVPARHHHRAGVAGRSLGSLQRDACRWRVAR